MATGLLATRRSTADSTTWTSISDAALGPMKVSPQGLSSEPGCSKEGTKGKYKHDFAYLHVNYAPLPGELIICHLNVLHSLHLKGTGQHQLRQKHVIDVLENIYFFVLVKRIVMSLTQNINSLNEK